MARERHHILVCYASELILTFCLASYAYSRSMIPPWSTSAQPPRKVRRWSATRETSTLLATAGSPTRIKDCSWIENKKKRNFNTATTPLRHVEQKKMLCDRVPHYTASTIMIAIVIAVSAVIGIACEYLDKVSRRM